MRETLDILWTYRQEFRAGLLVTLQLCAYIWTIGIVGGTLLGVAAASWRRSIGTVSRAASYVLSGVPVLVLLFWLHYPLQMTFDFDLPPFYTAVAALSIINVIAVSEAVRRALEDFPRQFLSAARVCGIGPRQTVLRVQLPLVFRQVLPPVLFAQIATLQATLFASLISVDEVFRIAQRINSQVYRPVQIYSALAVLFLAVCLPMHAAATFLKARYTRDYSER
ncbi:MAG TPA: ABC transporter permease subunit [Thermoanaerobaculia bacterium]|nr:ABC transporter permease subunit [Thermoanaerobaculia bacterium]